MDQTKYISYHLKCGPSIFAKGLIQHAKYDFSCITDLSAADLALSTTNTFASDKTSPGINENLYINNKTQVVLGTTELYRLKHETSVQEQEMRTCYIAVKHGIKDSRELLESPSCFPVSVGSMASFAETKWIITYQLHTCTYMNSKHKIKLWVKSHITPQKLSTYINPSNI